jgi:PRTRC genetic system ThiF family protein
LEEVAWSYSYFWRYYLSYTLDVNIKKIVLVGCGGTGSHILDGLCRLLIGKEAPLIIIDYDTVEPSNLGRQDFNEGDLGKFKSQVLAERYSRKYNRSIAYSVTPFMEDMQGGDILPGFNQQLITNCLVIGAVDNHLARQEMAKTFATNWWLDAGNGFNSGQVLIGNTIEPDNLRGAFIFQNATVTKAPLPSLQLPSLLLPAPDQGKRIEECVEAVVDNRQSPVINQVMATLVLDMVYRLLKNKLDYIGVYLDLEAGTMRRVPAEPSQYARMFNMKEEDLVTDCSFRARYHLQPPTGEE